MHRLFSFFALFLFLLPLPARAQVRVVATVPDLAALTRAVGGDHVKVTAMALSTQDPHFVDARPNLALDLSRADLLLLVGLDLEVGWLPTLMTGARNARIQNGSLGYLDASSLVRVLDAASAPVDRSMGDIHPSGNPHYLWDPRNGALVARGIADRLGQLDPAHQLAYQANLEGFLSQLESHRAGWESTLAPLRGARVVGYHKSWTYVADWLGLQVVGTVEPKPGVSPSPAQVAQLSSLITSQGVKILLQEGFYPSATTEMLAQRTGARMVRIPGGTDFQGGETYVQHLDTLVADLKSAAGL